MSDAGVPTVRPRVWLGAADSYDTQALRAVIAGGLEAVGAEIRGNAVGIVDWTDQGACTRAEFVESAMDVMLGREDDLFVVLTGRAARSCRGV